MLPTYPAAGEIVALASFTALTTVLPLHSERMRKRPRRLIRLLAAPAPRPPQLPPTQWTWGQALSLPFFCAAAVTPFSTTRGRCCLLPPPTPGAARPIFTCRGKQRARSSRERRLPTTRLWRPYQLLTTRTRKQHMPSNQSRVTFFSLQKRQTEHEDGPFLFFKSPKIS